MARFNEILTGRHNRSLQKLFSMKGGPPAPQLSSEINVTHNLFSGSESRYLEGWNRYWGTALSNAQAAINSAVQFRIPKVTNIIAVFEKLTLVTANGVDLQFSVAHNDANLLDLTNGTVGLPMDIRIATLGGTGNSNTIISQSVGATVDLGLLTWLFEQSPGTMNDFMFTDMQELLLLPGDTLRIRNLTVNSALRCNFMFRERFLEDSERT